MYNGDKHTLWTSWQNYEKVHINGQTYAKIGDRLYSRHAVNRMYPSGNRFTTERPREGTVDFFTKTEGRSISPSFVEEVITSTIGVYQPKTGNFHHTSDSVRVHVNKIGAVVTILTHINTVSNLRCEKICSQPT